MDPLGRHRSLGRHGFWRPAIVVLLSLSILAQTEVQGLCQESKPVASARTPSEYEVKEAFLLHFARFVQWPAPPEPASPFRLCIAGDDPFGAVLNEVVEGENIAGRRIAIRRSPETYKVCEVIFVSKDAKGVHQILGQAGPGVLTVGESGDFLAQGGMVAFVLENRRVRFDVSVKAATAASLQLSSRLLNVARKVEK